MTLSGRAIFLPCVLLCGLLTVCAVGFCSFGCSPPDCASSPRSAAATA
ncbi:MAG: hypothetical protein V8S72_05265 [Oscillospiraceae bacterium]